jgi:hypothetical protein
MNETVASLTPPQRRALLTVEHNPDARLDYVVDITGEVAGPAASRIQILVTLRYVPDKFVLTPGSFGQYLRMIETLRLGSLEALATTILDDLNNELVARWCSVSLASPAAIQPGVQSHSVTLEDRQPNWSNPGLLSRLRPY